MGLINCSDAVLQDGKLYYYDNLFSSLCVMDIKSGEINLLKEIICDSLVEHILKIQEKIILFPQPLREIIIYDEKCGSIEEINTFDIYNCQISYVYAIGDSAVVLPSNSSNGMLIFDLCKKKKTVIPLHDNNISYNIAYPTFNENKILCANGMNRYIEIDIDRKSIKDIIIKKDVNVSCIMCYGGALFALQKDRTGLLNINNQGEEKIIGEDYLFDEPFSMLKKHGNYIIALPRFGNYVRVYNTNTKAVFDIKIDNDKKKGISKSINCGFTSEGFIMYPWRNGESFLTVDFREMLLKKVVPFMDVKQFERDIFRSSKVIFFEDLDFGLKGLLSYLNRE